MRNKIFPKGVLTRKQALLRLFKRRNNGKNGVINCNMLAVMSFSHYNDFCCKGVITPIFASLSVILPLKSVILLFRMSLLRLLSCYNAIPKGNIMPLFAI